MTEAEAPIDGNRGRSPEEVVAAQAVKDDDKG